MVFLSFEDAVVENLFLVLQAHMNAKFWMLN